MILQSTRTDSPLRLIIWSNAALSVEAGELLQRETRDHRLVIAAATTDVLARDAQVALGQPDPEQLIASENVQWVHLSGAGYTRYDTREFRDAMQSRGVIVTNSSSVYCVPCAEHVLAMMMALSRQLPQAMREQLGDRPWQTPAIRAGCNILEGQTAIIYGFGAIGRRLAELLSPLRMKLIGVRRQPCGDESIEIVTQARAYTLLSEADHVVDALPETDQTRKFFDERLFLQMKRGANFYNIGRGATVDQTALQAALESNQLAAAYLDVTTPEPLPPEHPLWRVHNCFITPHVGGVHAAQYIRLVRHFLENLRRFQAQEPLRDRLFENEAV